MAEAKSPAKTFDQITQFIGGLTPWQRFLLVGGAILVGATLGVFVWLIGKPKYTTLYSGLRAADMQAMAGRLAAKNIPYETSPDGTSILVPVDKVDASRLETAAQGLPRNARLGFELFDTPNWAGSDFSEKVNYQRALEGELERTLQTLSEVDAVRVHLVMPRDSLFSEQEQPGKAAVIVKTRSGHLSEQAQAAIPALVASAVDKLRPENVTVVDADTNTPLLKLRGPGSQAAGDFDELLAKRVVQTLEPVVGTEHVRASVHVEYDLSTSENTEETYDPKATAAITMQRSEETMGGGLPAGVPGTASNVPGAASTTVTVAATQDRSSSRSESSTYAISKSVRHTIQPAGRVRRIAAAVLVDDVIESVEKDGKKSSTRRKRTPEEMKELERLASASIGLDQSRGDILALQNLSFQELPVEKPAAPTVVERSRQVMHDWSGLLRYLGVFALFAIVYFLLLRPVKREALAAFRNLPARLARPAHELNAAGSALDGGSLTEGDPSRRATLLKQRLTDKVKTDPAAASRLVQNWIRQTNTR
jgi:flagellar M-ring protein FliF